MIKLSRKNLKKLPNFTSTSEIQDLIIFENLLTSLEGSPKRITFNLDCSHNKLTDLVSSPRYIGLHFDSSFNLITSLVGCPYYVGGSVWFNNNPLCDVSDIANMKIIGRLYITYREKLACLPLIKFKMSTNSPLNHIDGNFTLLMNKHQCEDYSKVNLLNLQNDLINNGYDLNARWKP